jgi:hypothetical protein
MIAHQDVYSPRLCVRDRGIADWRECAEDDCEKLGRLDGAGNRQRIREAGLDTWRAEQSARVEVVTVCGA